MTPADLSRTVLHAVRRAVDEDALRAPVPARVRVERTRPGGSGDYACAVALQLAGPAALPALEVARILRERVAAEPGVGRVEITGPGFLSFTLDAPAESDRAVLAAVGEQGLAYGHGDALRDEIHQFHHAREVRAAVTAQAVFRLLVAQGARGRITCEQAPDPDWARLGVTVDAYGTPPTPLTEIRPVPAGATAGSCWSCSGPTRPAGDSCGPPDTTAPPSAPNCSSRARPTRSSGSVTPTPGPAPSPGGPPPSASPPRQPRTAKAPKGPPRTAQAPPRRPSPPPTTPPPAPSSTSSPTTPASSSPEPVTARPTGSPGSWKPSRTRSSTSTTPARPCPPVTRNPRPPTAPGWPSPKPPGRCWQAACPCSASARPNISDEIRREPERASR